MDEKQTVFPEETHPKEQPQKNWWKIATLSFLAVVLAGGLIASGFYFGP
ncbi:MAG: hypothetical protein HYT63_01940 [Candidatus Yanofskybacteria bacterium]|nr:hypothetical protein [Candidatus Yanofskybacteria bacterium]